MNCEYANLFMEQRRYKDIVAFKWGQTAPLAFHSRNLEVAEISEETWNSLPPNEASETEAFTALTEWEQENSPEVKSGSLEFGIRSLTLNVTQICNLKCTYCAAGGDGTYGSPQTKINVEKTLPQLKYFLDKVPNGEYFRITFLGGEPLLYLEGIQEIAHYVQLVTAERDIKAFFSVVTNGTLINEKSLDVLKNIRAKVTVSLDGPAHINDKMRPGKGGVGSTALVVEGLQKLAKIKDSLGGPLIIHGVFNKENMDLVAAYDFYRTLSADRYEFTFAVEENDPESHVLFTQQMELIASKAFADGGESELRKIGLFDQYFVALDEQQQTENYCGAGKSYLMVDARNNLYTCPWDVGTKAEQVGGNQEVNIELLTPYQQALIDKNDCRSCWARFLCGGGCMFVHKKATGQKNRKDGQFCSRTRTLIAMTLKYYRMCRTSC